MKPYFMEYLASNANWPIGEITSTARKGTKWAKLHRGDFLYFVETATREILGKAIVVETEVMSYAEIIARADENHATGLGPLHHKQVALRLALAAAYGTSEDDETFTMVKFVAAPADVRDYAFAAISSERDYQDELRGRSWQPLVRHSVAEFTMFAKHYADKAEAVASTDWSKDADRKTLDVLRKVAALCVACMEEHDAPMRKMPEDAKLYERVGR